MKFTSCCAGLLASIGVASAEIYMDRLPGGVVNPVERGVTYHINYETTRFYVGPPSPTYCMLLNRPQHDGQVLTECLLYGFRSLNFYS